jgi:hypothetical protein
MVVEQLSDTPAHLDQRMSFTEEREATPSACVGFGGVVVDCAQGFDRGI